MSDPQPLETISVSNVDFAALVNAIKQNTNELQRVVERLTLLEDCISSTSPQAPSAHTKPAITETLSPNMLATELSTATSSSSPKSTNLTSVSSPPTPNPRMFSAMFSPSPGIHPLTPPIQVPAYGFHPYPYGHLPNLASLAAMAYAQPGSPFADPLTPNPIGIGVASSPSQIAAGSSGTGTPDQPGSTPADPTLNNSSSKAKKSKAKTDTCKFGDGCTRPNCWFKHPSEIVSDNQHNDNSNHIGTSTSTEPNGGSFSSPQGGSEGFDGPKRKGECRYAMNCTRKACWYSHPPDWTPPNASRTPPEPPANECDPNQALIDDSQPAENNGWDASDSTSTIKDDTDWGRWDVQPSDDWGETVDNEWAAPSNNDWSSPPTSKPVAQHSNRSTFSKGDGDTLAKGRKETVTISNTNTPPSIQLEPMGSILVTAEAPDVEAVIKAVEAKALNLDDGPPVVDVVVDSLNTPNLEPTHTPTLSPNSEPYTPSARFEWGDEPVTDINLGDNQPMVGGPIEGYPTEDRLFDNHLTTEQTELDEIAPSSMYASWAPPEDNGWGDPIDTPDGSNVIPPSYQTGHVKPSDGNSGKGKEKQKVHKETTSTGPPVKTKALNEHSPFTSRTSLSSRVTAPHPESEPEALPEGLPESEIPDWLLGGSEDCYAALGVTRSITPKPAPPKLVSNRPRITQMHPETFPVLPPPPNPQKAKNSMANGPTVRPARRTAWKILSDQEASVSSKGSGKGSSKSNKGSRSQRK